MGKKIKLIYVLGLSHSGSTIATLILGTSPRAFILGEVKGLGKRDHSFKDKGRLCDCGKSLAACPYWNPVLKGIRVEDLIPKKITRKEKIRLMFSTALPPLKMYYSDQSQLYKKAYEQAKIIKGEGVEYLIDSSKELRRLLYLRNSKDLDIKVISIVRDARGFVNSEEKRGHFWLKAWFYWLINVPMIKIQLKRNFDEGEYLEISYDLFAQNPDKYIKQINDKFGLDINSKDVIKNINKEKSHNFGGNPLRRKAISKIRWDRGWETRMPKWKQKLLSLLSYLPNKVWVY